jgi:sugar lactone lactonase YvrE
MKLQSYSKWILAFTIMILLAACNGNNGNTTGIQMGGSIQGKPLSLAGIVTTLAGKVPYADGTGAAARFYFSRSITTDGDNLYIADSFKCIIRKLVIATGAVTTLAGTPGRVGSADGIGAAASFNWPSGITTDGTSLYVTDGGNNTIRKIVIATGAVSTLAGTPGSPGSADGIGASATFKYPEGITTDRTNLYVADTANNTVRKIVITTAAVSTLAGTPGTQGSADGVGTSASFRIPRGISTDGTNLYVADTVNYTIRKIVITTGAVSTLAGTPRKQGSADGIGAAASFRSPEGVTTDGTNLYVADTVNNTIRKIVVTTGAVSTLAGTPGTRGFADGNGSSASFNNPEDITTDGINLYVADTENRMIRKVVIASGTVTTLAGTSAYADGIGTATSFNYPQGVTTDGANLYVTDSSNHTIRKIVIATGVVTTLAGTPATPGFTDGSGPAAGFKYPFGITTDGTNLYVADSWNHTIRKVVIVTGAVTTLAGTPGTPGSADGIGAAAGFNSPGGITTDGTSIYVADSNNYLVRKIVIASGAVTTLAGTSGAPGSSDGVGTSASFNYPGDITTDGSNLYLADVLNNTIRKIEIATGAVITLAGIAGTQGSADGIGSAASFYYPRGLTTDGSNLYVSDSANHTIRKIVIANRAVTTLAGTPRIWGFADDTGLAARFDLPIGITTDGNNLYVVETYNMTIRMIH